MKVGQFEVMIADDPEHEKVYAVLQFGERSFELYISNEVESEFRIEFPGGKIAGTYPLDEFLPAVDIAVKRLKGELP